MKQCWLPFLSLVIAGSWSARLNAEVASSGDNGFHLKISVLTSATPHDLYQSTVTEIHNWWSPAHTYSGDSQNLYLEAKAKGWFGERLPDGGFVRHMEIVYLAPNKAIRMIGGLGPLQEMGVHGALTIQFKVEAEQTNIELVYSVTGYSATGFKNIAPAVDRVLAEQMQLLQKHAEGKAS